jgi:hypothetical protein
MLMGAAIANSRNKNNAAQAAPAPAQQSASGDAIEQIKQLAELRDQGILTDAEFEAKKKQLLGL